MTEYRQTAGKRFITFPAAGRPLNAAARAGRLFWSLLFLPYALTRAKQLGTPGLECRIACIGLGLRAIAAGDLRRGLKLIANPMDSFRYFEAAFALRVARGVAAARYLDVSSPRLVPLLVARAHQGLVADLINPLPSDLQETAALAKSVGMASCFRWACRTIDTAGFPDESFDLITSVSVVEHIPDDTAALAVLWRMLRPGGKLVLTVPCAREACEEYTNIDEYGLLKPDREGYVYWQRYYSEESLRQRVWSVTGPPTTMRIFGERWHGAYDRNVEAKRTDAHYRYWEEPILMGSDFRNFERLEELIGMGVVAMEFTKKAGGRKDSDR